MVCGSGTWPACADRPAGTWAIEAAALQGAPANPANIAKAADQATAGAKPLPMTGYKLDLLEGLVAAGRVRRMPVERIMNVMGDLVYGTVLTNHIAGRKKSFEEQTADIMEIMFNGILSDGERGRRPRRGANGRSRH